MEEMLRLNKNIPLSEFIFHTYHFVFRHLIIFLILPWFDPESTPCQLSHVRVKLTGACTLIKGLREDVSRMERVMGTERNFLCGHSLIRNK